MILLKTFKNLLGNGRAWNLSANNIKTACEAIILPFEVLKNSFYRISKIHLPTQNIYAKENDIASDIENLEKLFAINLMATLYERAANIEAQWGLIGGQGWQYIENVLLSAKLPVKIVENIPINDLSALNNIQYGSHQFGGSFNSKNVQYGQSKYILIGNGFLNINGIKQEIVSLENSYSDIFVIEGQEKITSGQLEILIDLILKTKPQQAVCLAKLEVI